MLGKWSLGDYWKEEAIKNTLEFQTQFLGIPLENYAVTCFAGNKDAPKDTESQKIWLSLGIPKSRIAFLKDNWWGPAGNTGPCGPDTEQFFYTGEKAPKSFDPEDDKWVEFGNDVLMQYIKSPSGKYLKAPQQNIDFGGGVERTLAILNGLDDHYQTSVFLPMIKEIESISKKPYKKNEKVMRIIADHIKAATFILGDEKSISPSNEGQGYVLRRLIRRAIRYGKLLGIDEPFISKVAKTVLPIYPDYQELKRNHKFIVEQLDLEEQRFSQTLEKGLSMFNKLSSDSLISGKEAFLLFQSYGFPIEMTEELANEKSISIDLEEYNKEFKKHQDLSRTSSAG